MTVSAKTAPGQPGDVPHWTSGAKSGVGKSFNAGSNVTFTLSHGIVNEVYFPREDIVCIAEFGLIVTNGKDFFSDERTNCSHKTRMSDEGVPAYQITNTCNQGKFVIGKEIVTDPIRNSLLQRIKFRALDGIVGDYNLYTFISPHIKNYGDGNSGWLGDYKGMPMMFAEREGVTIAIACSIPPKQMTVGYKGASDAYNDVLQ